MGVTFTVHRFKGAAFWYYYISRLIINKSYQFIWGGKEEKVGKKMKDEENNV
jgi:hypothetical protein